MNNEIDFLYDARTGTVVIPGETVWVRGSEDLEEQMSNHELGEGDIQAVIAASWTVVPYEDVRDSLSKILDMTGIKDAVLNSLDDYVTNHYGED